jgi:hypothetical protein
MRILNYLQKRPLYWYCLYLLAGVSQVRNVGISWDEPAMRGLGASAAKYLILLLNPSLLSNFENRPRFDEIQDFQATPDGDHGVVFELLLIAVETLFNLSSNTVVLWQVRHLITFLFCSLSIVFIFQFLRWRFSSLTIAYLGSVAFALTPRIYGDAFFNQKDSVLLTAYFGACYFLVRFLVNLRNTYLVLSGVWLGFAMATRPVSLGLFFLFLMVWIVKSLAIRDLNRNDSIKKLLTFSLISVFTMFVLSPYLWQDPINRVIKTFVTASSFPWIGKILTGGQVYDSQNLPWHYVFAWIGVTVPLIYILMILSGLTYFIQRFLVHLRPKNRPVVTNVELADLFILLSAIGPIVAVIVLNSTLYDGWRHLYFVYPSLLVVGVHGFKYLYQRLDTRRTLQKLLLGSLVFNFATTGMWMIHNSPLHNIYFNQLAGGNIRENWEMDYWGTANLKTLKFLLAEDSSSSLSIYVASATPLFRSLELLPRSEVNRIEIVSKVDDAKYIFTNYRDAKFRTNEAFEQDFEVFHESYVGSANVNTLLIKRNLS